MNRNHNMDEKNEPQSSRAKSKCEGQLHEIAGTATSHNIAVVDNAIQTIGFGKYQIRLFFTCGFGFFVDQVSFTYFLEKLEHELTIV